MEYFKPELFMNINSLEAAHDEEFREKNFKLLDIACKEYNRIFDSKIKAHLSKSFLSMYHNTKAFHDYFISKIGFDNCNKSISIKLVHKEYEYILQYKKIFSFNMSYKGCSKYKNSDFMWWNDEFDYLENGYLKHNILCFDGGSDDLSEFEIVFKNIIVKREKIS